jgi:hypothetical protein
MKKEVVFDSAIWEEFQKQAKRRRLDPVEMLTEYMQECLDTWEFDQLFKEIRRDARKSGYKEEDAVEIVRQYRREKREQAERSRRAAS